jgi:4-alpha-glucanotransferase
MDGEAGSAVGGNLAGLAAMCGVATRYRDWNDRTRAIPADTVRRVLAALGVPADDDVTARRSRDALTDAAWRRALPGSVVTRQGTPARVLVYLPEGARARVEVRTEQGQRLPVALDADPTDSRPVDGVVHTCRGLHLPGDLPAGYHCLAVHDDRGSGRAPQTATLIVAPRCCPGWVDGRPLWGWMLQLYALRSRNSWGMGDLGVLRDFAAWSGRELGAGMLLCNPLHAAAPVSPQEPSPYFPSSRRFTNPLYLHIESLPELARLDDDARELAALAARARRRNRDDRIDRDAVFEAKQRALTLLHAVGRDSAREAAFAEYRRQQGQGVEDYGLFCALAERHGVPWGRWPAALRHPSNAAVAEARSQLAERVDFHVWLQWLCSEQLAAAQEAALAAGMPVGVIHDLAVGADLGGADGWALQDDLATDMTVGAPPDAFNQRGQDWRLPPLLPNRLVDTGYAPFRDLLRSLLRHAGGIRIDHALGLFRLWWVPDGLPANAGTYVRYPAADLLGVLSLEANRASTIVVAEDLGTVEAGLRDTLLDWGLFRSSVLYFERTETGPADGEAASGPGGVAHVPRASVDYPRRAFASITTHDLPTAAGFWAGEALRVQEELGLLAPGASTAVERRRAAEQRAALRELLRREGLVGDDPTPEQLVVAMHAFLARTPSLMVAVALSDTLGDLRQPNMPGTTNEYPNWRLPLAEPRDGGAAAVLLEELYAHPGVQRIAEVMRAGRVSTPPTARSQARRPPPRGPGG